MTTLSTTKVYDAAKQAAASAVFELADNTSASLAAKLMTLGFDTRSAAKPYAMKWASVKYKAKVESGQRGDKLPRDSAAEKAMNRVLSVCFPGADNPFRNAGNSDADPVAKLIKAYGKLDGAQKRSFKAQLAKQ